MVKTDTAAGYKSSDCVKGNVRKSMRKTVSFGISKEQAILAATAFPAKQIDREELAQSPPANWQVSLFVRKIWKEL